MKKLQKKAKASRAAARAPRNKSHKVRAEVVPQEALYRIEVWGECAEYLEDLISRHGGQLDRNPEDVLFLNTKESAKLLALAAPIEFRMNGCSWVLRYNERAGGTLTPLL
jgi:hypothetical protein